MFKIILFAESLGSAGVHPDVARFMAAINGGNLHSNLGSNNSSNNDKKSQTKQPNKKSLSGVLTAANMYEPGFRIQNAGLCSPKTRLLVLITSAAAPAHSQNRQAIRMTWMNRYGPVVSMAFLVGTPQMSKTDPVAQVLEAEEQALQIRLSENHINSNNKPKENPKFKLPTAKASGTADNLTKQVNGDPGLYRILRDQEPIPGEGLDAFAMNGLNEAEQAVQRVLGREHSRYGDIVQCQSRDTYTNLTLKSIAALEWTRQHCPWAQYLLKTDDDMFIDVFRLLRFIDKVETEAIKETGVSVLRPQIHKSIDTKSDVFEYSTNPYFDIELPPTIWGRLAHGWRPIRQHNSKYYVSRTQYTGRVYPDFCTGPAYLMTRSAVNPLYEAALGNDFDIIDSEDEDDELNEISKENKGMNKKLDKDCNNGNLTLVSCSKKEATKVAETNKNSVPYLKLEDVYLTGVVAERLTRRAAERLAREERKKKKKNSSGKTNSDKNSDKSKTKSKAVDIIVKIRRVHNDQFANKKITGRALERAVCSSENSGDTGGSASNAGFSWFRWYWGDATGNKETKKKKKDQGVISLHMVKYFEQFDLWRRLMDGRTKCKT